MVEPQSSALKQLEAPPRGSIWFSAKFRSAVTQIIVILALLWMGYEIVVNTTANLTKLNKSFGFDFLGQSAGFEMLTSLVPYSSASSYGRALVVGFWNTMLVSCCGIILATVIGFTIGIMRLSKNPVVAVAGTIYVETLRNIPLLLQLFMWYALVLKPLPGPKQAFSLGGMFFVSNRGVILPLPIFGPGTWVALLALSLAALASVFLFIWARKRQAATGRPFPAVITAIIMLISAPVIGLLLAGWPLSFSYAEISGFNFRGGMTLVPEFLALWLGLSTYTASFIAETVRSGIQAVAHGQSEASAALGLTRGQSLRLVVIPQALRVIIPPLASQYLNLTKNSSLAIAIAYPDLVAVGGTVLNQSGKAIEIVAIWMVVYLTISLLTAAFMNWFNARMKLVER